MSDQSPRKVAAKALAEVVMSEGLRWNLMVDAVLDSVAEPLERAVYEAWGCCSNEREAVEYVLARLARTPAPTSPVTIGKLA